MRHAQRRVIPIAVLALALPAWGQDGLRSPPASGAVLSGPAGNYTVTAPRPVRVIYGPSSVTIDWTGGIDPTPPPTPPGPTPDPPTPPTPEPPKPEWGPLARVIILYESTAMTGREPIYAAGLADALTKACPPDTDGRPAWRVWDRDLDVSKEPSWLDAMAKAKAALGTNAGPVLYAFDGQGRAKEIPLPATMAPAEAVSAIQKLSEGVKP
jgi:hypothetical protein